MTAPAADWPDPVNRGFRINQQIDVSMQGPSELGPSGKLLPWDRSADLRRIEVPTLVIGAQHDTMDPASMAWMATQLPRGRHLHCPNGSHMAMSDDRETYFRGLIDFVRDVDRDRCPRRRARARRGELYATGRPSRASSASATFSAGYS